MLDYDFHVICVTMQLHKKTTYTDIRKLNTIIVKPYYWKMRQLVLKNICFLFHYLVDGILIQNTEYAPFVFFHETAIGAFLKIRPPRAKLAAFQLIIREGLRKQMKLSVVTPLTHFKNANFSLTRPSFVMKKCTLHWLVESLIFQKM